jgi:uncharacterized protein (TIGR03382 family)
MRTILIATVLAGCAWTAEAQAAADTWNFSYTGFYLTTTRVDFIRNSQTTAGFEPELTLKGSFSGADNDHDGVIELSELTGFDFNGYDYYACAAAPSPYGHCTIGGFSYALTGQLAFSARYAGEDEFISGWYSAVTSGVQASDGSYRGNEETDRVYDWTGQTRFSIAQVTSPVPEPASGAMAAAGLVLLGLLGRRRRSLSYPA